MGTRVNITYFLKQVGRDEYDVFRDGQFLYSRSRKQLPMDNHFHRDHANLMRELGENGEATREFLNSSIRQFNPFPAC
jgi:hypothetical protein